MNEDITNLVLDYREAIRHLWNSHAKYLDSDKRFGAIEHDYFYLSVLSQAETYLPPRYHSTEYYYHHVNVVPKFDGYPGKFLLGRKNNTGGHDYEFIDLHNESGLNLKYIDFFDLSNNREREYKYVKAYILEAERQELNGCVVLLEADNAQFISTIN